MLSQCRSCGQRMDSPRSYGERNRDMANPKVRMYREQSFGHLKGLAGISDRQIAEQLALYAGYVRQVNRLNEELAELRLRGRGNASHPEFAEVTRRLGFEYNGMILHEYYFANLKKAADPRPAPGSALGRALEQFWGGVGWVVLAEDPVTDRLSNHWITLHQDGFPAGFKPMLVMDVWEHAFMRDYK